jgi:colicin import membrane protein
VSASRSRGLWSSLSVSVLLHLALVAVVAAIVMWVHEPKPREQRLGIEGRVVTSVAAAPEPQPQPAPEDSPPEPQTPPDTSAQDAEAAALEAEAARVAEERRLADEALAAERRAQDEAQQRKVEQAARENAELERKERERQLEQARARREAELNAQIAAEERVAAARASGLMAQYIGQIASRIESKWIRPGSVRQGLECEVRVTQVPGGVVTDVKVGRCNGDESVRQSIEAAVYRASPLPQPPDPALFERNLVVTFRPEN